MQRVMIVAAALVAMTLATPAMAQTGTIEVDGSDKHVRNLGARFNINPTANWDAAAGAWRVHYSVDIDMALLEQQVRLAGAGAVAEMQALKAKYADRYWFQMRYANTYTEIDSERSRAQDCWYEQPAAYNHELIGGLGWSRSFLIAPEEDICLTVWIYGDNLFSQKGNKWQPDKVALGSAWFVAPAAP